MNDNYDPTDLVGQERKSKEIAKDNKIKRDGDIEDFLWMMGDKRGRRFIWRLLDKAGVYRSSFTGNSNTFFLEGQRNMGLMIMDEIHSNCPDLYVVMLKENSGNGSTTTAS